MVRRGLVITYYFPPLGGGGVQRWSKFIKYLSHENWQFTVITRKASPHEVIDSTLLQDIPETTIIKNVADIFSNQHYKFKSNYLKRWITSLLFVTDSRKSWVNKAWGKVESELKKLNYDAVICSIPPYSTSEIINKIKQKYPNIPVVLDMRDPWTINPYKIYPTPIHKYLDKRKENSTINNINHIISAYKSTFDFYENEIEGFEDKNTTVISNGYDESDFENLNKIKLSDSNIFNIAFSGTFYSHLNNPDILFRAIGKLKQEGEKITFHHLGSSAYNIDEVANKYGISNEIVKWGYKNHRDCLEILNSMDALVVILNSKIKNADKMIGGKVYEYLRLEKPILGLVPNEGEAAQLLRETNSGVICHSLHVKDIAKSILSLKSKKFEFKNIEQFSRQKLANKLNKFLLSVVQKN